MFFHLSKSNVRFNDTWCSSMLSTCNEMPLIEFQVHTILTSDIFGIVRSLMSFRLTGGNKGKAFLKYILCNVFEVLVLDMILGTLYTVHFLFSRYVLSYFT